MKKEQQKILLILLIIIIFIMFEMNFFLVRATGKTQIDDVHPQADCEPEYLEKSDILWVIPQLNGHSIIEDKDWCEEISSLNKTIGMHGIYHTWKEFTGNISRNDIELSLKMFEDCFDEKPTMFKPPQLTLSSKNKKLLEEYNLTIKKRFNQITHKIYHCNNTGLFSNKLIDAF